MPDYLALQAGLVPYYYLLASCFAPRDGAAAGVGRPALLMAFVPARSCVVAGRCGRADSTCCVYRRLARRMSEYTWLSKKG
jgi:hypothetical protein